MPDRTPLDQPAAVPQNPPSLVVAASLVALQGVALVTLAVVEALHVESDHVELGVAAAGFFLLYGGALVACAFALVRRQGWARGPVLITQLIQLGLAWNVRETPLLALALAVTAALTLAGMLHPASIAALMGPAEPDDE